MKCRKCGELIDSFATKCPVCGAPLTSDAGESMSASLKTVVNPTHTHGKDCSVNSHPGKEYRHAAASIGLVEAIRLFFQRFADFNGRSRRSEYWWVTLSVYILNLALTVIAPELGSLLTLVLCVPCMALCVRRLHDVGKSGWWYLLFCVPFGALVLLYWFCKDSGPDNRWGPNPKK